MKKVIILGAGVYQVPLIKKAKELGIYTIVISTPGDYLGFSLSDKNYYVDTRDKEKVLEIAKAERIDGICTSGTDVAVISIGYVNDHIGLKGVNYNTAVCSTNKLLMKQKFIENGVKTANFYKVTSGKELKDCFEQLSVEKAVAKIVDKSGSRGIRTIDKRDNFELTYNELINESELDYIIVEEYIEGIEIGIDAFVSDSQIISFVPHNKIVNTINGIGIPAGHIVPYTSYYHEYDNLYIETQKVINAIGITNGAINIDAFVKNNNDVYIIEVGARAGATGIPEIISNYLGQDYYEMILDNSLNKQTELIDTTLKSPCASVLIFSEKDGIYNGYVCKDIDGVSISMDYEIGHLIERMKNGTSRIGQAIIKADNLKDLKKNIEEFRKSFIVKVG